MASLTALRQALATNAATIAGLTGYATVQPTITAPAAVVGLPHTIEFGQSLGPARVAKWTIPVRLYVADASEPAAQTDLDAYLDTGSGQSIVKALESDPTLGGSARALHVTEIGKYGTYLVGQTTLLGCEVTIEILA